MGQFARERSQASLRQRNNNSRSDGRSSIQGQPLDDIYEKIDHLQIQIDRVDGKMVEVREDQMKGYIDPRPIVAEQIDNLMTNIELKFAPKTALNTAIDNLGEEIAGDINSIERQLKLEGERLDNLSELHNNLQDDMKVCQISIAKVPLPGDPTKDKDNFSESLVKQLLRQGHDRKTSIEETKMLSSKLQEVKLTQKRQRE